MVPHGGRQVAGAFEEAPGHIGTDQPGRHGMGMQGRIGLLGRDRADHRQLVPADPAAARRVHADVATAVALQQVEHRLEPRQGGFDPAQAEREPKARHRAFRPARQPHPQRPDHQQLADVQIIEIDVGRPRGDRFAGPQIKR